MLRGLPAEHFDAHTVRIEREERVVVALQVAILLGRKVNPSAASETPHVRVIDLAPMIHLEGEMFDADVVVAMSTAVGRPEPEHRARSRVLEVHHLLGSTVAWVADALGPPSCRADRGRTRASVRRRRPQDRRGVSLSRAWLPPRSCLRGQATPLAGGVGATRFECVPRVNMLRVRAPREYGYAGPAPGRLTPLARLLGVGAKGSVVGCWWSTTQSDPSLSQKRMDGSHAPTRRQPAVGLGARLSYLDAVLAVVKDVPSDQRPAQCRNQGERRQRREFQSGGEDREHADARASLPGPTQPGLRVVFPRMKWTSRMRRASCVR